MAQEHSTSMVYLEKVHSLNLIMRKHQITMVVSSKCLSRALQKCQDQDRALRTVTNEEGLRRQTGQLSAAWELEMDPKTE